MRVVLDTNVLVQVSLAPFGPANGIIALIFTGQVRPLFDERILAEYEEVLTRPLFALRSQVVERLLRATPFGWRISYGSPLAAESGPPFTGRY